MSSDPVIVGIATFDGPGRRESLMETLESIEKQADYIYVYMNDYADAALQSFFSNVSAIFGETTLGDLGDAGKFYGQSIYNGSAYFLTLDDDLILPPDYVETIVQGIEKYNREAVVSFHGREYYGKQESYYQSRGRPRKHYPCLVTVQGDHRVPVLGSGCAGWHSSLLSLSMEDFTHRNMADILFSRVLNELEIPRIVLGHSAGWIKHSKNVKPKDTIHAWHYSNDRLQTTIFNSVDWKL